MSKLKFDCKTSEARLPIFITNTIRLQPQPTSSSRGGRLTMENRHRLFSGLGGFWFLGFVSCKLKSGASNKLGNTDVFLSNRSGKVSSRGTTACSASAQEPRLSDLSVFSKFMKVTLSLRLTHRREEDATRAVLILEHLPATEHRHQPGCGD